MNFCSPYTVEVVKITDALAQCEYFDAKQHRVPPDQPLTTSTQPGSAGELRIKFKEATLAGDRLRLAGAAVKTVGHAATLDAHNFVVATRDQERASGQWMDTVVFSWLPGGYTLRGAVLLFAQVDADGNMLNFFPSTDPQIRNNEA